MSPDLRYAVIASSHQIPDEDGTSEHAVDEYAVFDGVAGRVVGRVDVNAWEDPGANEYHGFRASWSPDGGSVAFTIRRAIDGLGWLVVRLLILDARSGDFSTVDIAAFDGLEPVDLLGWTPDGHGFALSADEVGTDQAPRGHLVYDRSGSPVVAHRWAGGQASVATPVVAADGTLLLATIGRDGIVVQEFAGGGTWTVLRVELPGYIQPVAWRDGEVVVVEDCHVDDTCDQGVRLLGIDAAHGSVRVLATLPPETTLVTVAPATGLGGDALIW